MIRVPTRMREFVKSEEAASATEYAFMLALIVLVAWAAMAGMGQGVRNSFAAVSNGLPGGTGP